MTDDDDPPRPASPAARDPAETIRRILIAARQEFATHGFDGVRMEEIAARAQVSRQTIYHYFRNKDGLYWELLKDIGIDIYNRLLRIDYDGPPDAAIRKYVEGVYEGFASDPLNSVVSIDQSLHHGAQLRSVYPITRRQEALNEKLAETVRRGQEQGIFHPGVSDSKVEFMTAIISTGCLASSRMHARFSGRAWPEDAGDVRQFAVDFIMRALRN